MNGLNLTNNKLDPAGYWVKALKSFNFSRNDKITI